MKEGLKPLYIIGAGGFGREVAWMVERINAVSLIWDFKGFLDDDSSLWNKTIDGYNVHGGHEILEQGKDDVWCVMAVGNAAIRKSMIRKLQNLKHIHFATLIDSSVSKADNTIVGEGSIICGGTTITVDTEIGNHVIINMNCTLGHDDRIGDFVTIYPGVNISGNVCIGEYAEIGTGAAIIQGIGIGIEAVVGAGAIVYRNVRDGCTVVGNPAKVVLRR